MSVNIYYVPTIYDAPPKRFQASFRVVLAEDYAALEANFFEVVNNNAIYVKELLKLREEAKPLAPSDAEAVKLAELIEDAVNSLRVDGHFDLPDQLEKALAAFREKQGRVS